MNKGHMEFCTSADWREILEKLILPGVIDRVDLGPQVVEVGPGPGFTTDVLRRFAEHVTAIEIDPTLVDQLRNRLSDTTCHGLKAELGSSSLASSGGLFGQEKSTSAKSTSAQTSVRLRSTYLVTDHRSQQG